MKLTIKIKKLNDRLPLPEIISKGEWVDLRASGVTNLENPQVSTLKRKKINGKEISHRDINFQYYLIPLGVAMKLPEGFEAHVLPRSSTFKTFGITMANSTGIIDCSYCGNLDEWKFGAIAWRDTTIKEGDRICQFRIQLSQKATLWQKIKWFFSNGIEFKEVEDLGDNNRGGIGSTGIN